MTREDIITQVQVRLDELSPFDDIEEVPAINYIDKLLDSSTNTVFRILPCHKLPADDLANSKLQKGDMDGEYYLDMLSTYIKFCEAKFTAWKRPVKRLASPSEEILQGSKYTMGKPDRPIVVENKRELIVKLHFFSVPDGGTNPTKTLFVISAKKPEDCPDLLVDAIAWQCASDVLISLGKEGFAKLAQEKVLTHGL